MSKYFKWAELPPRKDVYVYEGTTKWGNHDLYPIPKKERTYDTLAYYSYYVTGGVSINGFTMGSTFVAAGLSVWATVGGVLLGSVIAGLNSFLGGQAGIDKSLGYTMMTRATFGLWGSYFPLIASMAGNMIYAGINAYYGGQAICVILGAIIPQFHNMANTLPASAAITTQSLVGFLLYWVIYVPITLYVPIWKLQKFLIPSMFATLATLLGILGWIVHQNGGTGSLVSSTYEISSYSKAFLFLQVTSTMAAVWGGSGDRMSDWTRFAKKRHSATPAMLTGLPIFLFGTSIIGALATSAYYNYYGTAIWNPLDMMLSVQSISYTPACRAGTFFAGIGLLSSQIFVNIVQNTLAFGMDFTGMFPKYFSIKRSAMLLTIISIAINPWRFLSEAVVLLEVLNICAIFAAVDTAMINCDYWLVRRRKWKVPDLYHAGGIYWYTGGFNIRAIITWFIAIAPSMPGFCHSMMGYQYETRHDYRVYQMTFFVGYPLAFLLHLAIAKIFPPEALGVDETLPGYETGFGTGAESESVLEGTPVETTYSEKGAKDTEVKV